MEKKIDDRARLVAKISREEMDFIDKISKDALFSTGHKLSRADIISAIIDAIAEMPVTGKNIHSKEELRNYIDKIILDKIKEWENGGVK